MAFMRKNRLNLETACYHAVQNISPSQLLPRNVKIKKKSFCPLFCIGIKLVFGHREVREEHRFTVLQTGY